VKLLDQPPLHCLQYSPINIVIIIDHSANSLQHRNNKLKWIKDLFGDQAVLLDSAKWTTNLTMINDVVDWLGFDQTCRFKELLEFNTQGHGFQNEHTELSYQDPSCQRI